MAFTILLYSGVLSGHRPDKSFTMLKKIIFLLLLFIAISEISAQVASSNTEAFYVNLFISADKTIYAETEKIEFNEVQEKVSSLLRNRPFQLDQKVIYRIFADENLKLGLIVDLQAEMSKAEKAPTQKFLLNTTELNIDGQDWFQAIDLKELKSHP